MMSNGGKLSTVFQLWTVSLMETRGGRQALIRSSQRTIRIEELPKRGMKNAIPKRRPNFFSARPSEPG